MTNNDAKVSPHEWIVEHAMRDEAAVYRKICEDEIRESKRMENPLKLKRIHHVEFWVGNARQAAYFYRKGFGFSQVAYSGLETGQRQRASYAMSQGKANFVLTTPMTPDDFGRGSYPEAWRWRAGYRAGSGGRGPGV